MKLLSAIQKGATEGNKKVAVLIDPDKHTLSSLQKVVTLAVKAPVDFFLFGGSLLTKDQLDQFVLYVKNNSDIPVLLFPGNTFQITPSADAILFLSLISGRNPDLLIGKHVIAAPYIKASGMEAIPTGYMLVDGGKMTTVAYMSNTVPIPSDKSEIAVCTALAGELLGMKVLYLDAGSGAARPVPAGMIGRIKENSKLPLFVGGGITTPAAASTIAAAGADIVVVGNILEKKPGMILRIAESIHNS